LNAKKELKKRAFNEFKVAARDADNSRKLQREAVEREYDRVLQAAFDKYKNIIT